ncbi:MAG: aldehyde dehydrogenase [Enterovirga sp.]|nr:aldehyde dehydrogenase [Enterovirga sp.]
MSESGRDRPGWLRASGVLLVVREARVAARLGQSAPGALPENADPDIFLALEETGIVTVFSGHVDLGTGIRTALAQIVAEELDIGMERVRVVLGDTHRAPDQGGTIASETIQVTAVPLRKAAAQARHALLARAAAMLDAAPADLVLDEGAIRVAGGNRFLGFGDLVRGEHIRLTLDDDTPVKPSSAYRLVGRSMPRVDIPAKAAGTFTYVHDVRLPGMLHGRVIRPPYAGVDAGEIVGNALLSVDESSIADLPGLVAVVRLRDFLGVVAEREEQAIEAAGRLAVAWRDWAGLPDLNRPENALRANPAARRVLVERGDVDAALAGATARMDRTYLWPYQMHASIGPSCAVADYRPDGLTVWSGTQNPHWLRGDLAFLLALPEDRIAVVRLEAAGCYGRNCADDVSADAALLSRAVGRPVRVQLTREQEHSWEPKGPAQVMDVRGGLDATGEIAAYDLETCSPMNRAPTLALLLTGTIPAIPEVVDMGDRTAVPPYDFPAMRIAVRDMAPIVRASWLRGVSALPNTFAHESYIDELATAAGVDPLEYRLRYLKDPRAVELVKAVANRAGWQPHTGPGTLGGTDELLFGRGLAYALYMHGRFPGTQAAWSAWIADVAVNTTTGEVSVTRVVVGQDTGLTINPAGVQHQIHGNVIQAVSRVLKEEVSFDDRAVTSREWGAYPIATFSDVPAIDVVTMDRQDQPPLGAGESATVPSAAAIANALFDATGVRFRELPLTPERVRAALTSVAGPPAAAEPPRRRGLWGYLTGAAGAAFAALAILSPWRPAYGPIPRPDPSAYSAATIERGRLLAAAGACAVCHIGPGGVAYAGGLPLETPFGTVYGTNITPDPDTGIGAWSYPAFERLMREGIRRDGAHVYPAHPYTAFTRTSDADLQALYGFLMAQVPQRLPSPETRLRAPFNIRPAMAAWNALFLTPGAYRPDPARSEAWNRGAYLVEGLGHCGGCHSPRNGLGAERTGARHLAGGTVDGWEAPPLSAVSPAPVPWTEADFTAYLTTGFSPLHGVAAGPMKAIVEGVSQLPPADIRAIATYLASFQAPPSSEAEREARAAELGRRSAELGRTLTGPGARIYQGACSVCHDGAAPALAGVTPLLALNTGLHAETPDNLLRVVLDGAETVGHGAMPAFRDSLDDRQLAELVAYLRARFAPDATPWANLPASIARARHGAGDGARR